MSGMTLFDVYDDEDEVGSTYFPTRTEAERYLKEYPPSGTWTLDRITLVDLPPRRLACRLLRGEGFVTQRVRLDEGDNSS